MRIGASARAVQSALLSGAFLLLSGCNGAPEPPASFLFRVSGVPGEPGFVAQTEDTQVIAAARGQLALPEEERWLFISGPIERGDGGHNLRWSWHFTPSEWALVDVDMELCDADPAHVEETLDQWIAEIGIYCPWNSYVAEELQNPARRSSETRR